MTHNITPKSQYIKWLLNYLNIKTYTCTTNPIKQILKDYPKAQMFLSDARVYKIHCLECNKLYIGGTSWNLNKIMYVHEKILKLATQQIPSALIIS